MITQSEKFTTVTYLDSRNIEHFHTVIPNWQALRPDLWDNPMVVMYDKGSIDIPVESASILSHPDCDWVPFPLFGHDKFFNRKIRAESACLIGVSYCISTRCWLKLDCSCYATSSDVEYLGEFDWMGEYSVRARDIVEPYAIFGKRSVAFEAMKSRTNQVLTTSDFYRDIHQQSSRFKSVKSIGWKRMNSIGRLQLAVLNSLV